MDGALENDQYIQDMQQFADWGVDALKVRARVCAGSRGHGTDLKLCRNDDVT